MSVPTTIFIDTSILDGQNYNFSSGAISALLEITKNKKITLLIPNPTSREIQHHIEKRSKDVVKTLKIAERKAPFLKKLDGWPIKEDLLRRIQRIAGEEWQKFQKHFNVIILGYKGVDLEEIMNWYNWSRAPFGEGKKRKEFPDAIALSTISLYAQKNNVSVAVVSTDKDFEKACTFYNELLYFPSLPAITEALLSPDKHIEEIKELFKNDPSPIMNEIKEDFPTLGFYHDEDFEADIEDIEVDEVSITNVKVIHIGKNEVVLAFDASVDYSAYVRMDDHSTASIDSSENFYMVLQEFRGTVNDSADVSGVVKCSIDTDWKRIREIIRLEFQEDSVDVSEIPEEAHWIGE